MTVRKMKQYRKEQKPYNSIWKKTAVLSIVLNICILSFIMPYGIIKVVQHENISWGGYYDNVQYEAYTSMFKLNNLKTDIVFLGDSITARGRFEEFFPNKDVLNRGIGSDVSEGVLNRIDEVEKHDPSAVFLMIGINDLGHSLPIKNIISNVRQVVQEFQDSMPVCDIYIQSVLPAVTIDLSSINELNKEYEFLAEEYENCTYIDIYKEFVTEKGKLRQDLISGDGVHLNGKGYEVWINTIEDIVCFY